MHVGGAIVCAARIIARGVGCQGGPAHVTEVEAATVEVVELPERALLPAARAAFAAPAREAGSVRRSPLVGAREQSKQQVRGAQRLQACVPLASANPSDRRITKATRRRRAKVGAPRPTLGFPPSMSRPRDAATPELSPHVTCSHCDDWRRDVCPGTLADTGTGMMFTRTEIRRTRANQSHSTQPDITARASTTLDSVNCASPGCDALHDTANRARAGPGDGIAPASLESSAASPMAPRFGPLWPTWRRSAVCTRAQLLDGFQNRRAAEATRSAARGSRAAPCDARTPRPRRYGGPPAEWMFRRGSQPPPRRLPSSRRRRRRAAALPLLLPRPPLQGEPVAQHALRPLRELPLVHVHQVPVLNQQRLVGPEEVVEEARVVHRCRLLAALLHDERRERREERRDERRQRRAGGHQDVRRGEAADR